MVNCPACNNEVNEDFGMVTCPHCKAVFMIDYSGKIQYGNEEEATAADFSHEEEDVETDFIDSNTQVSIEENTQEYEEPESEFSFPDPEKSHIVNVEDEDFLTSPQESESESEVEEPDEATDFFESENYDFDGEQENNAPVADFGADETLEEDSEIEEPETDNFVSNFQSDLDIENEPVTASFDDEEEEVNDFPPPMPEVKEPDNKPVDITEFANSEDSSLEGGEYLYTVQISRIDSKDLRDDLKYVLMDEKLKLDYVALMRKISSGKLLIPDLHPIKAKRIVEQLQFFDLEVRWVQKRVIMEEPIEEEAAYEEEPLDEV
ncbi:MAG: hypothetical protein HRT44_05640 [Bdellovibrionales bacterium]|nr:hypothetical protein [Bdellovibrionales bacterium]NQZ18726.1 hypothetical protein [Bdellovibrionales bacterium]